MLVIVEVGCELLDESPLDNIENTRTIESVWIAGNRVPDND